MKAILVPILVAFAVIPSLGFAEDSKLSVDQERSKITFVSDAPAEKIMGTAENVSGDVVIDLEKLTGSGVLSFPVSSMKTGNALRDKHLRSADWLNAEKNPTVQFYVTTLENPKDVKRVGTLLEFQAEAVGTLYVNGTPAPTRAKISIKLDTAKQVARVETKFSVRLADHKVQGKKGVVGNKVGETIAVQGLIYAKVSK